MTRKVLILEPHPYHQEILPGFVKYFHELDYQCDVYVQESQINSNVFSRFAELPNLIPYNPENIQEKLKNLSNEYDFIFFSSLEYFHDDKQESFLDFLSYIPKTKFGVLAAYHTVSFIDRFNSQDLYEEGRIFSLAGFNHKNKPTALLAPTYFGKVKVKKELNKKIKFITVGGINLDSKNHNLLFPAIDELKKRGYKNFEIIVIGGGKLKYGVKNKFIRKLKSFVYKKHIKHLGRLDFVDMFLELEKADFFLPLLDYSLPIHHKYLSDVTSGSRNLILGFQIPCLINEYFAKAYAFTHENSIIHSGNNLADALIEAIEMKQEKYREMQSSLEEMNNNIQKISLYNLKSAIEKCIHEII